MKSKNGFLAGICVITLMLFLTQGAHAVENKTLLYETSQGLLLDSFDFYQYFPAALSDVTGVNLYTNLHNATFIDRLQLGATSKIGPGGAYLWADTTSWEDAGFATAYGGDANFSTFDPTLGIGVLPSSYFGFATFTGDNGYSEDVYTWLNDTDADGVTDERRVSRFSAEDWESSRDLYLALGYGMPVGPIDLGIKGFVVFGTMEEMDFNYNFNASYMVEDLEAGTTTQSLSDDKEFKESFTHTKYGGYLSPSITIWNIDIFAAIGLGIIKYDRDNSGSRSFSSSNNTTQFTETFTETLDGSIAGDGTELIGTWSWYTIWAGGTPPDTPSVEGTEISANLGAFYHLGTLAFTGDHQINVYGFLGTFNGKIDDSGSATSLDTETSTLPSYTQQYSDNDTVNLTYDGNMGKYTYLEGRLHDIITVSNMVAFGIGFNYWWLETKDNYDVTTESTEINLTEYDSENTSIDGVLEYDPVNGLNESRTTTTYSYTRIKKSKSNRQGIEIPVFVELKSSEKWSWVLGVKHSIVTVKYTSSTTYTEVSDQQTTIENGDGTVDVTVTPQTGLKEEKSSYTDVDSSTGYRLGFRYRIGEYAVFDAMAEASTVSGREGITPDGIAASVTIMLH